MPSSEDLDTVQADYVFDYVFETFLGSKQPSNFQHPPLKIECFSYILYVWSLLYLDRHKSGSEYAPLH